jgi:hypothetical protein
MLHTGRLMASRPPIYVARHKLMIQAPLEKYNKIPHHINYCYRYAMSKPFFILLLNDITHSLSLTLLNAAYI